MKRSDRPVLKLMVRVNLSLEVPPTGFPIDRTSKSTIGAPTRKRIKSTK
jgi:hypothetical protein